MVNIEVFLLFGLSSIRAKKALDMCDSFPGEGGGRGLMNFVVVVTNSL